MTGFDGFKDTSGFDILEFHDTQICFHQSSFEAILIVLITLPFKENILFFHCIFWNHRCIMLICIHCKDISQCGFGTCGLWENLIPKLNVPFQTYKGNPFLIVLSKLDIVNNCLEKIIPVSFRIFTSLSKAILFTKLLILLPFCATTLGAKAEAAEKVFHFIVIDLRWWNMCPHSVDLEYFCQINPPKTWTQHHTAYFGYHALLKVTKEYIKKILQFWIFTDSDQRSEGKVGNSITT